MALINIMSIAMAPNPRTAAIYYFITALFILLACFDTYFALPLNVSLNLIHLITYSTPFISKYDQIFKWKPFQHLQLFHYRDSFATMNIFTPKLCKKRKSPVANYVSFILYRIGESFVNASLNASTSF